MPENNLLLRQMQFVAADIGSGRYCWNGECRYCEIQYRAAGRRPELPALACRVKGLEGMVVTKVAPGDPVQHERGPGRGQRRRTED